MVGVAGLASLYGGLWPRCASWNTPSLGSVAFDHGICHRHRKVTRASTFFSVPLEAGCSLTDLVNMGRLKSEGVFARLQGFYQTTHEAVHRGLQAVPEHSSGSLQGGTAEQRVQLLKRSAWNMFPFSFLAHLFSVDFSLWQAFPGWGKNLSNAAALGLFSSNWLALAENKHTHTHLHP